jgi:hypothetical protein
MKMGVIFTILKSAHFAEG